MLEQLLSFNIFGFFLIFARVGTTMMVMPGISAGYVSRWVRLGIAMGICVVVSPLLLPVMPAPPAVASALFLLVLGEVIVGVFMGGLARIAVGALQTAGTMVALVAALANTMVQDAIAEQQSSIVSSFYSTTGILLIFVTDLHHLTIRALVESYVVFEPAARLEMGDLAMMVTRHTADAFALGLQLAAPIIVTGICYYVLLGIFGRLMPALPVFFFMMPMQIVMQFVVMAMVLGTLMLVFLDYYRDVYMPFIAP